MGKDKDTERLSLDKLVCGVERETKGVLDSGLRDAGSQLEKAIRIREEASGENRDIQTVRLS